MIKRCLFDFYNLNFILKKLEPVFLEIWKIHKKWTTYNFRYLPSHEKTRYCSLLRKRAHLQILGWLSVNSKPYNRSWWPKFTDPALVGFEQIAFYQCNSLILAFFFNFNYQLHTPFGSKTLISLRTPLNIHFRIWLQNMR